MGRSCSRHHALLPAAALLLSALLAAPAQAQPSDPDAAQRRLYDQALEAMERDDYDTAIRRLEAALRYGDLNVILLSLGRAWQKKGDCERADRAFNSALKAPAVEAPTPDAVARTVEEFQQELRDTCPGTLLVDCTPPELTLRVQGHGTWTCYEQITLPAGTWTLTASDGQRATHVVTTVEGLATTRVAIAITDASGPDDEGPSWFEGILDNPLTFVVGGALTIGLGGMLDTLPASAGNFQLDALDFAPLGLYMLGGAALGWGVWSYLQ